LTKKEGIIRGSILNAKNRAAFVTSIALFSYLSKVPLGEGFAA
jgi:hypothetical protein